MSELEFELTATTCGSACWEAREDICRCSCGGKNHGIFRHGTEGVERPPRSCKIDGVMYQLEGIGNFNEMHTLSIAACRKEGKTKVIVDFNPPLLGFWHDNDAGAPAC